MANINLTSSGEAKEPHLISRGMGIVLTVFISILIIYVAVLAVGTKLDGDIAKMKEGYNGTYEKLRRGNASEVADFKIRMDSAREVLETEESMPDSLTAIEKSILPNIYLDSFEYDNNEGAVTLVCVSDNYNLAAKQIISFKNSQDFAGVIAGESKMDVEENKIDSTIILKLK
jgi:hypothetical protein